MSESGPYIDPNQLPLTAGIPAEFKDLAEAKYDILVKQYDYNDLSESDAKAISEAFEDVVATEAGDELKAQAVASVYAVSKYLAETQTMADALYNLGLITQPLPDTDRFNALFAISFSWRGLPEYSQELRESQVVTNPEHLDRLIATEAVSHAVIARQYEVSVFSIEEINKSDDLLKQISSPQLRTEAKELIAGL